MKIAIISDVHNNETNLKKVLDYCQRENIQTIICCGDLASQEALHFVTKNFAGTFYYTFGNMDDDFLREFENVDEYKNAKIFHNFGEAEFDNKKIAFVHYSNVAEKLSQTGKYDFVFYGHTHKPWVASAEATADQELKKCTMLNPGNVAGELYPPTFAVWNTENNNFELIRVHDLK